MSNYRINAILRNDKFNIYLKKIEDAEKGRIFCLHNIAHFMDVARIAYILNLEKDLKIPKELVYAAALLHDIGRWQQYEDGTPHDKASIILAKDILKECGFDHVEIHEVLTAISHHKEGYENEDSLSYILFFSDKASRACYSCKAYSQCYWSAEKKNDIISY